MSWNYITPFWGLITLLLVAVTLYFGIQTFFKVRRLLALDRPLGVALMECRGTIILVGILLLVLVWWALGASSAWRPEDKIKADYRPLERKLEQVDKAKIPTDLPVTTPSTPKWEDARKRFRDQAQEETEQFNKAVEELKK